MPASPPRVVEAARAPALPLVRRRAGREDCRVARAARRPGLDDDRRGGRPRSGGMVHRGVLDLAFREGKTWRIAVWEHPESPPGVAERRLMLAARAGLDLGLGRVAAGWLVTLAEGPTGPREQSFDARRLSRTIAPAPGDGRPVGRLRGRPEPRVTMRRDDPDDLRADLDLAIGLAELAAGAILPHFRRCAVEWKPDGSEVTAADREAERRDPRPPRPRSARRRRPRRGVRRPGGPIGGLAAVAGRPDRRHLLVRARPAELRHAGRAARWRRAGRRRHPPAGHRRDDLRRPRPRLLVAPRPGQEPERVRVAPPTPMASAFASTTGVHSSEYQSFGDQIPYRLGLLIRACRTFFFVGDCIQHALVCRGRLHVAVDTLMSPWDIAALVPCVEEAGGVVTGLDGRRSGSSRPGAC